jgi:hypothetical protein
MFCLYCSGAAGQHSAAGEPFVLNAALTSLQIFRKMFFPYYSGAAGKHSTACEPLVLTRRLLHYKYSAKCFFPITVELLANTPRLVSPCIERGA